MFDVPLKEQHWAHKWRVDVHNVDYSKNLNVKFTLEISEGHTQDV